MAEKSKTTEPANHIAVFQEATIRHVWHNEEWWFALSDVIVVLTDTATAHHQTRCAPPSPSDEVDSATITARDLIHDCS